MIQTKGLFIQSERNLQIITQEKNLKSFIIQITWQVVWQKAIENNLNTLKKLKTRKKLQKDFVLFPISPLKTKAPIYHIASILEEHPTEKSQGN